MGVEVGTRVGVGVVGAGVNVGIPVGVGAPNATTEVLVEVIE